MSQAEFSGLCMSGHYILSCCGIIEDDDDDDDEEEEEEEVKEIDSGLIEKKPSITTATHLK